MMFRGSAIFSAIAPASAGFPHGSAEHDQAVSVMKKPVESLSGGGTGPVAIVAFRPRMTPGSDSYRTETSIAWLAGVLYAHRVTGTVGVCIDDAERLPHPDSAELGRFAQLAHGLNTAWPDPRFESLGAELTHALASLPQGRVGFLRGDNVRALRGFKWLPGEVRLTASIVRLAIRGRAAEHAGIHLRLTETAFADDPELHEQLLLREMLKAVDYYAPPYGYSVSPKSNMSGYEL